MSFSAQPRIGLGTGRLGATGRGGAFALLDAFVDLGGTLIDTAAVYSDWIPGERGRSETVIGEWLKLRGNRDKVVIATKGAHPPLDDVHKGRLDSASLRHDIEESLRRLQTDHIDLWLPHRDDMSIPVAEILGTLGEFVAAGKIGAIGVSNWSVPRIAEARALTPAPVANQLLGNILCLKMSPPADDTLELLDAASFHQAEADGISLMLFSSQCLGAFTEKKRGTPPPDYDNPACATAIADIRAVAQDAGVEADQLVLAFLLQFSPAIVPLIGPQNPAQVEQSMQALELKLTPDVVARLAKTSGFDTLRA